MSSTDLRREMRLEAPTIDLAGASSISRFHRKCIKAPSTGTTLEGLLFCAVSLYVLVTSAAALYPGAITAADSQLTRTATVLVHERGPIPVVDRAPTLPAVNGRGERDRRIAIGAQSDLGT